MNAKSDILQALRRHELGSAPALPTLDDEWTRYDNLIERFIEAVGEVKGGVLQAEGRSVASVVLNIDTVRKASKVYSTVASVECRGMGSVRLSKPHEFSDVDVAVVEACFGVAENGAVWITDEEVRNRSVLFLAQHIVVLVRSDDLVHNMHEAYERTTLGSTTFGCFISGPSKTADIEQALVIGAHGPRSVQVVLL